MKSLLKALVMVAIVLSFAAIARAQTQGSTAPVCANLPTLHTDQAVVAGMSVINGFCYHPADLRTNTASQTRAAQTTQTSTPSTTTVPTQPPDDVYRDVWREERQDSGRDWDFDINTRNLRRPSIGFRIGGYKNNSRVRGERISTYPAGSTSGIYRGGYGNGVGSYRRFDGSVAPVPRFGRYH